MPQCGVTHSRWVLCGSLCVSSLPCSWSSCFRVIVGHENTSRGEFFFRVPDFFTSVALKKTLLTKEKKGKKCYVRRSPHASLWCVRALSAPPHNSPSAPVAVSCCGFHMYCTSVKSTSTPMSYPTCVSYMALSTVAKMCFLYHHNTIDNDRCT